MRNAPHGIQILVLALAADALIAAADSVSARGPAAGAGGLPTSRVLSGRVLDRLAAAPGDTIAVWFFLRDRGPLRADDFPASRAALAPRAAVRRERRAGGMLDESDVPVYGRYIDLLRGRTVRIRHASRYFNAVSADVRGSDLGGLASEPWIVRIDLVATDRRPCSTAADSRAGPARSGVSMHPSADDYGGSRCQLERVGAAALLDLGFNGSGAAGGTEPVLVAILDTGFRLDHRALRGVAVEAQWDFIDNDSVTANEPGDEALQDMHGTTVLGVIAGRLAGEHCGPAWGARYLLAKTEIRAEEIEIEEDHWVAGIEWADSAGADIVTSSLGYYAWYTADDLDGGTALCTRAADIAVSHGIVVVNSAGNRGTAGLVAPADGDSVIAVGAVDCEGAIAYFSSRGPTADGRIKPDFVAPGYAVQSVAYPDTVSFAPYSGTSFAAPLVAGICAQLLEVHSSWNPLQLREALRATASRSGFPDNSYGYGIPDAALAAGYPHSFATAAAFPNPFNAETRVQYSSPSRAPVAVRVYDCRGALVRTLVEGRPGSVDWTVSWDGTNAEGRKVASGVYFLTADSSELRARTKIVYVK